MQIFFRGLDKTHILNVEACCSVKQLMDKIYDQFYIPPNAYYLTAQGKILDKNKNLADYDVTELSSIELTIVSNGSECRTCQKHAATYPYGHYTKKDKDKDVEASETENDADCS